MPVKKCSNGKWRIGSGRCMYTTKKSAEKAYKGYLVSKYGNSKLQEVEEIDCASISSKDLMDMHTKIHDKFDKLKMYSDKYSNELEPLKVIHIKVYNELVKRNLKPSCNGVLEK